MNRSILLAALAHYAPRAAWRRLAGVLLLLVGVWVIARGRGRARSELKT